MKVPQYQRTEKIDVVEIPQVKFPRASREAFGNAGEDLQDTAKIIGTFADKIYDRYLERKKIANEQQVEDSFIKYSNDINNRLFSDEIETVKIDGLEVKRPYGLLNRKLSNATGALKDYVSYNDSIVPNYLETVQDPEYKLKLKQKMNNLSVSRYNEVNRHESVQYQEKHKALMENSIAQQTRDFSIAVNGESLLSAIRNIAVSQEVYDRGIGTDPTIIKTNVSDAIQKGVENSVLAALHIDTTGEKSYKLLKFTRDDIDKDLRISTQQYNDLKMKISKTSKAMDDDMKRMEDKGKLNNFFKVIDGMRKGTVSIANMSSIDELSEGGLPDGATQAFIQFTSAPPKRAPEKSYLYPGEPARSRAFVDYAKKILTTSDEGQLGKDLVDLMGTEDFFETKEGRQQAMVLFQLAEQLGTDKNAQSRKAVNESSETVKKWQKESGTSYGQAYIDFINFITMGVSPDEASSKSIENEIKRSNSNDNKFRRLTEATVSAIDKFDIDMVDKAIYEFAVVGGMALEDASKFANEISESTKIKEQPVDVNSTLDIMKNLNIKMKNSIPGWRFFSAPVEKEINNFEARLRLIEDMEDRGFAEEALNFFSEGLRKPLGRAFYTDIPAGIVNVGKAGLNLIREGIKAKMGKDMPVFGGGKGPEDRTPEEQAKVDEFNKSMNELNAVEDKADKLRELLLANSSEEMLARNPKVFEGDFMQNPSWTRAVAGVAQSAPMSGLGILTAIVTGNPLVGGYLIAMPETSERFNELMENGKVTPAEAIFLYGVDTIVNGALESVSLRTFAAGVRPLGKIGKNVIKGLAKVGVGRNARRTIVTAGKRLLYMTEMGIQEGPFEEGSQHVWGNLVNSVGEQRAIDIFEGISESIIIGFISGFMFGGFSKARINQVDKMISDAKADGVNVDEVIEATGEAIKANDQEIYNKVIEKIDRRKFNKGRKKSDLELAESGRISSLMRRVKGGIRINEEILRNFEPEEQALLKRRSNKNGIIDFSTWAGDLVVRFPFLGEKSDMDIARMVIDRELGKTVSSYVSDAKMKKMAKESDNRSAKEATADSNIENTNKPPEDSDEWHYVMDEAGNVKRVEGPDPESTGDVGEDVINWINDQPWLDKARKKASVDTFIANEFAEYVRSRNDEKFDLSDENIKGFKDFMQQKYGTEGDAGVAVKLPPPAPDTGSSKKARKLSPKDGKVYSSLEKQLIVDRFNIGKDKKYTFEKIQEVLGDKQIDYLLSKETNKEGGGTMLPDSVKALSTEDLETLIDKRYESGAIQEELDALELEYAARKEIDIATEDSGEADEVSPDLALDELLARSYKDYIIDKMGGMSKEDIAGNIRSNLSHPQLRTGFSESDVNKLSDDQAIKIAKDAYDRRMDLIKKKKNKEYSSTPSPAAKVVISDDQLELAFNGPVSSKKSKKAKVVKDKSVGSIAVSNKKKKAISNDALQNILNEIDNEEVENDFGSGEGNSGSVAIDDPNEKLDIDEVDRQVDESKKSEFKLSRKVHDFIKKYAGIFGERYVPKKFAGVYLPKTKTILLKTKNAISVAMHEVTHYMDDKFKVREKIMRTVESSTEDTEIYDPATFKLRQALTDAYVKWYGRARRDHPLYTRVTEGIAVFFEHYAMNPDSTKEAFPYLYDKFIDPNGEYYNETMVNAANEMNGIFKEYQALSPADKIGARIADTVVAPEKPFLNITESLINEHNDDRLFLEKLEGKINLSERVTSSLARMYDRIHRIAQHNISDDPFFGLGPWGFGNNTYVTFNKNGRFIEKYKFNWSTLIKSLPTISHFNQYLVARRTKFAYDYVEKLGIHIDILKEGIQASAVEDDETGELQYDRGLIKQLRTLVKRYNRQNSILKKDNMPRNLAEAAYQQRKPVYDEFASMYDKLVEADWDVMYKAHLISENTYEEGKSIIGYTPFKRDIFNEIIGDINVGSGTTRKGKKRPSSLITRTGSGLDISSPVYESMRNHFEITKKAYQQLIRNAIINNLAPLNPEIFVPDPRGLMRQVDDKTGKVTYPQDLNENIMMAYFKGKRIPYIVDADVRQMLEDTFSLPEDPGLIAGAIKKTNSFLARQFVKGTTGRYPLFALTNFVIDQLSAVSNTQNNFIPIYTPFKNAFKLIGDIITDNTNSPIAQYFKEFLMYGGEQLTFLSLGELKAQDAYDKITREKHLGDKIMKFLRDYPEKLFTIPVTSSEILTRFAEYAQARKNGHDPIIAFEMAGRVSVPFHHKGKSRNFLNTWIRSLPYMKSSMSVIAQQGRSMTEKKTAKRALLAMSVMNVASVLSMLAILKGGSEEQKEIMGNLQPEEIGKYLYAPNPNGKDLMRLRMPEQAMVLSTAFNMAMIDLMTQYNYSPMEYIRGITAFLPDQVNPTDFFRLFASWIPQSVSPVGQVVMGKRFYPTVKDLEPFYMRFNAKEDRYFENTTELAKFLGPKVGLSPIQFETLFEGYTGRFSTIFTGKEMSNPFIKRLHFTAGRQMINYYEQIDKNKSDLSTLEKNPDKFTEEEYDIIEKNKEAIKNIQFMLKDYRDMMEENKNETNEDTNNLRTLILDEIDSLK
jgi:hypothetical protein